jgi:serine/threonine protein kinase
MSQGVFRGRVLGPYQLLAPLGRGGMGTVFLARDGRNGQVVALKVLPPQRASARRVERFRREMELSRRVAHPHLAWTYDAGEHGGVHYLALEYIPGRTLARLVADEGPLPLPRAARLLAEVARGLEHAHRQGLIHRDLKPSNIQVTPRGHAKVLDLGLALLAGERGADPSVVGGQGYVVGTMDYIAPEQIADSSRADHRSDIYSLGCTLYFAVSGERPFPGGTSREKLRRHRSEEPVSLAVRRPGLPAAFVALVERLMAKDPALRPPSAGAVAAELLAWAAEEPADPPAPAEEEPALPPEEGSGEYRAVELPAPEEGPGRWPDWAALLVGLALGVLAGATFLVVLGLWLARG